MTHDRAIEELTVEDFRVKRGTRFRLAGHGAPDAFEIELAEITEFPAAPASTFRTPFSVLFHGPLEPVLPQGIYDLEHEQFRVSGLFIVPIGPADPAERGQAATAMRYEAVFG